MAQMKLKRTTSILVVTSPDELRRLARKIEECQLEVCAKNIHAPIVETWLGDELEIHFTFARENIPESG